MALPTLTLLDNFNRANEVPISNGGKWARLLFTLTAGNVENEAYGAKEAFAKGEEGAYWTPAEFTNPAVAFTFKTLYGTGERYCVLWACVNQPNSLQINGYRVRVIEPSAGSLGVEGAITVERMVNSVGTNILTLTKQNWAIASKVAVQVAGGKVIIWKENGSGWTVVGEVADSTYTKGFVGMGSRGNIGRIDNLEAGETVGTNKPHTLSTTQGSAATEAATRQAVHTQSATQASAASKARALSRVLSAVQASSYGPQLPPTPLTVQLENEEGEVKFPATEWTVLSWAESIGEVFQLNKGLTGKPKPTGWGGTELKTLGARYNVASFRDPINSMMIRESDDSAAGRLVAIGICVPSSGERSGYVARIEATAELAPLKVTLERWVNGVKTVLAETTIANNYFGAASTFKEAPFALTLVGGVLRLWLAPSGTPTVLLSATDTTFTSGYNTMESVGKWMLAQEHAATMDGLIALTGQFSKGQALSTTQGSSITRAPTQVARTLSSSQASAITRAPTRVARTLSTAQPSSPRFTRAPTRALSATQGSSATRGATVARPLSATQGSAASKRVEVARSLAASQPQAISRRTEIARHLSFGVTQVAAVGRTLAQRLTSSQGSAATRSDIVARTLSTTQGSAPVLRTLASRAMVAANGASAAFARAIARTLRVTQPQGASQEGAIVRGANDHPHTLSTAQGASAALQRALTRRLVAGQAQGAALGRAVSRTLAISGGAAASVGRALPRTLNTSATSVASLRPTQVAAHLSALSSSSASLRRAVSAHLSATTGTVAVIEYATIEVPLPPAVSMSGSTSSTSGDGSLGQSRLTSSVESRR